MTTFSEIKVRSCPRCRGAMDHSEPEEPKCINCGHRTKWGALVPSLIGSALEQEPDRKPANNKNRQWRKLRKLMDGEKVRFHIYYRKKQCWVNVDYFILQTLLGEYYGVANKVTISGTEDYWGRSVLYPNVARSFKVATGMRLTGVADAMRENAGQ